MDGMACQSAAICLDLAERRHVVVACAGLGGIAHTGHFKSARVAGLCTRDGILDHQTVGRGEAQHFGGLEENFRVRLGMGDVVAVADHVEVAAQTQLTQDEPGVLLEDPMASFRPSARSASRVSLTSDDRSAGGQLMEAFPVEIIFLGGKLHLLFLAQGRTVVLLEDDLQTFPSGRHPAGGC